MPGEGPDAAVAGNPITLHTRFERGAVPVELNAEQFVNDTSDVINCREAIAKSPGRSSWRLRG
jgi:hypothetical protein